MDSKKYNILIISLSAAIVVVIVATIVICLNLQKNSAVISGDNATKTIMVYMVGSDLESKHASATTDLLEMSENIPQLEDINIVVYLGGANQYYSDFIEDDENAILELSTSGFSPVETLEPQNMGSSDTLSYFINYVTDNYQSDQYSLILWDHGGGPLLGYGLDETTNDLLSLSEISKALSETSFNSNNKLGFIGFDACLMASFEVAYTLSDYADYLIASQEAEPGYGWNYEFLNNVSKESDNIIIGKSIIDSYFAYFEDANIDAELTLSLFDLSKTENVNSALNNYFAALNSNLTAQTFTSYAKSRNNTKTFGEFAASTSYDLVDLYNMVDLLDGNYESDIKNSIGDLIIYNKSNIENANGVSIYYPYSNKSMATRYTNLYRSFGVATNYTNYLNNFVNILTGNRLKTLDISTRTPEVSSDIDYDFILELTDEQASNLVSSGYMVFRKNENNFYETVYSGDNIIIEDNTLKLNIRDKGIKVTATDDETEDITLIEVEKTDDYISYFSPVMLSNLTPDMDFNDYELLSGFLQIKVYNDGKVETLGIVPNEEADNVAPKLLTNLDDWHTIQFLKFSYNIFDEAGNYTSDWESSGIITGWELYIDEITGYAKADFKNGDYYCIFSITDSQGNISYSQAVPINN